jgi:Protein kinase domain.
VKRWEIWMSQFFASRFRLLRSIPSNSQSEIWLARDLESEDDERVVVKILKGNKDEILREFFIRESAALTQINHPGVVKIKDYGLDESENKYWLSLKYIDGNTLEERIKSSGGLKDVAVEMMMEIMDAVAAAHSRGIIHRDLKPSNIMCKETGEITVLDFGVCKIKTLLQEGVTVKGFGTPPFTAPEQLAQEDVDNRADVYSLGIIFFYMLTGTVSSNMSIQDQVDKSDLPHEYKKIINKMTALNKSDRYPSVLIAKREIQKIHKNNTRSSVIYYLKPSQLLCNSCRSLGLIDYNTEKEAIDWLNKELNENVVSFGSDRDGNWVLLLPKHKISATLDSDKRSLRLRNIYFVSSVDLARNREWAYECNVTWKVIPTKSVVPKGSDISYLIEEFENWKKQQEVQRKKDNENKKILLQWENILRLQRKIYLEKEFSLSYNNWDVSEDSSNIIVKLDDEVANPHVYVDLPILMNSTQENRKIRVGTLAAIDGKELTVSLHRGVNIEELRHYGEVTLDNNQVSASLKRQEDAIRAAKYGDSVNPDLLNLLNNPNINNHSTEPINVQDFINDDLDDAKKLAVQATLKSNIYLIQGPPGTGKTKVISEIIGQILRSNPSSKILLASQSNAAVDNALEAVAKLQDGSTLLRIGRKEKIDDKLSRFQLEETLKLWVNKTKNRSNAHAKNLRDKNNGQLNTLAEYVASLRGCIDIFDTLADIDQDLSRAKYSLLEAKNSQSSIKSLQKKVSELEQERDSLLEVLSEELAGIYKYLGIKNKKHIYYNLDDLKSTLQYLEKEIERKKQGFNRLDQIELIRQEWLTRLGKGKEFDAICASQSQVVASTCLGVSKIPGILSSEYDWVIIDEAGRATPSEILVPLVRGKRILLVGDHKQLPPVVELELTKEEMEEYDLTKTILERSLFEELFNKASNNIKSVLNIQYRMHNGIGSLVSQVFYDGTIENAESTHKLKHNIDRWKNKSVVWVSTSLIEERFEQTIGKSKQNQLEARIIMEYCELIEKEMQMNGVRDLSVGIISGYSEQKMRLNHLINPKDKLRWQCLSIDIDNVDAFQGQEREIVFYSVVRSNKWRDIGFLRDYRRLNVAFSRARKLLVVVGDHEMVQMANTFNYANPFAEVLRHIEKIDPKNCIIEVLKR